MLLRSDGWATACGNYDFGQGQCEIPALDEGLSYQQVSAGRQHAVLLRSDGQAICCGKNSYGQCNIPVLLEGEAYLQVSAGLHTVLLRNDGCVLSCGSTYDIL